MPPPPTAGGSTHHHGSNQGVKRYKSVIDFSGLHEHDDVAKAKIQDAQDKEKEPFLAEEVLILMSLSRLIESVRFTIPVSMLDDEVTKENLKDQLIKRINGGDPTGKDSQITEATVIDAKIIEKDLEELEEKFEPFWACYERCKVRLDEDDDEFTGKELLNVKTYGDFFDYQFPLFPELTAEDRAKLKLLCTQRVAISKQDVADCLGLGEDWGESQVIQYIFTSGSEVIAVEVFKEILQSLSMEPQTVSFAPHYIEHMLGAGRRLSTLLPNVVILVLLLVLAPLIAPAFQHSVFKGILDAFDDQWGTGCNNGTTSPLGCNFLRRNFYTSKRPTFDALRFTREEAVLRIWGDPGESAKTLGSTWLLGAMVIRLVPDMGDSDNPFSCSGNQTTSVTHLEVGKNYGCDALWTITIPFNATQEEALALAGTAHIKTERPMSTAIIFDFTGFQRANGLLVHTRAVLSLPYGGGVIPRVEISPIDPNIHNYVLPLLIVQSAAFLMFWSASLYYAINGEQWFDFDLIRSNIMMAMSTTSYFYLWGVGALLDDEATEQVLNGGSFFTTTYLPGNFDKLASDFNIGMSLLGFYVLFFITFLGRFFRDVPGLELVVSVLTRTYVELLCLGVVFVVWTIGFIGTSLVLFGPTVMEFSNFTIATLTLSRFFFGQDNYEVLSGNSPILGAIFFFFFQLFVLFFALNLLIAVLTAPLTDIKKESKVENELLDKIENEVVSKRKNASVFDAVKFRFYSRIWAPLVIVIFDARPIGSSLWLDVWKAVQVLYPNAASAADVGVISRLNATLCLLRKFEDIQPTLQEWYGKSELYQYVVGKQLIKGKVSMALVLGCIVAESNKWWVRDARLLMAAYSYQRWVAKMEEVLETQETLVPIAQGRTGILAGKLTAARECAEKAYKATPLDLRLRIARGDILINKGIPNFSGLDPSTFQDDDASSNGGEDMNHTRGTPRAAYELDDDQDEREVSRKSTNSRKSTASATGKEEKDGADASQYHFAEKLAAQLQTAPLLLVYAVVIVVAAVWIIAPFFQSEMNTAFLARSASDALGMEAPYLNNCDDADCESALSFELWLSDVGNLGDFRSYIEKVIIPQIFIRADHGLHGDADGATSKSVWWDPRIELGSEGITIRQLKGARSVCTNLPSESIFALTNLNERERHLEMQEQKCFHSYQFDQADLTPPSTIPAPFSQHSYQYQSDCKVSSPNPYLGSKTDYPCEGYYVSGINSSSHVWEVLNSDWLAGDTRLVVITVPLSVGGRLFNDFVVMAEFGDEAEEANVWTFNFERGDVDLLKRTESQVLFFQIIIAIHILAYIIINVRYLLLLPATKDEPEKQDNRSSVLGDSIIVKPEDEEVHELPPNLPHAPPEPPLSLLFIVIFCFAVVYPVWDGNDRQRALTVAMIIYLELVMTQSVVFPAASMMSKQVKILLDTLSTAAMHCCYVLPFLIIFYISFSYSGLLIFGRCYAPFSLVRTSILEIVLGTFGRADSEGLQQARPVEAQVFIMIFFCAVLIVLANMFLAMVTSASADAQYTPPGILVAENVQYFHGRSPMFGQFLTAFLATCVKWEEFKTAHPKFRKMLPRALRKRRAKDPVILTPWGRMWFPLECLLPRLRPLQANRILKQFHHDKLNSVAAGALVPFVLQNFLDFRDNQLVKFTLDEKSAGETGSLFAKSVAIDWFISQCQRDLEAAFQANMGGDPSPGQDNEGGSENLSFYPGMRGLTESPAQPSSQIAPVDRGGDDAVQVLRHEQEDERPANHAVQNDHQAPPPQQHPKARSASQGARYPTPSRMEAHDPSKDHQPLINQVEEFPLEAETASHNPPKSASNSGQKQLSVRREDEECIRRLSGTDWTYSGQDGLYFSEAEGMFFDVQSQQFFDPDTQQWFDPERGVWYVMEQEPRHASANRVLPKNREQNC